MASMWRSKLGGEFTRESILSLDAEHLSALRRLRAEPHNACCADCGRVNNAWASVNLGVFLCDRCADVHRALGTHMSKVKSCTGTDLWGPDELTMMEELDLVLPNKQVLCGRDNGAEPSKEVLMDRCLKKYGLKTLTCENTRRESAAPSCSPGHSFAPGPMELITSSPPVALEKQLACVEDEHTDRTERTLALQQKTGPCKVPRAQQEMSKFDFDDFFAVLEPKIPSAHVMDCGEQFHESLSSNGADLDRLSPVSSDKNQSLGKDNCRDLAESSKSLQPESWKLNSDDFFACLELPLQENVKDSSAELSTRSNDCRQDASLGQGSLALARAKLFRESKSAPVCDAQVNMHVASNICDEMLPPVSLEEKSSRVEDKSIDFVKVTDDFFAILEVPLEENEFHAADSSISLAKCNLSAEYDTWSSLGRRPLSFSRAGLPGKVAGIQQETHKIDFDEFFLQKQNGALAQSTDRDEDVDASDPNRFLPETPPLFSHGKVSGTQQKTHKFDSDDFFAKWLK